MTTEVVLKGALELRNYNVYLSGGINGLLPNDARDWREFVNRWFIDEFHRLDIDLKCIDPMRGTNFTEGERICRRTVTCKVKGNTLTGKEIVARDLSDVARSDVLLVELSDPNNPYRGTLFEMAEARRLGIPIIVWSAWAQKNFWLNEYATIIDESLENCCKYIIDFMI